MGSSRLTPSETALWNGMDDAQKAEIAELVVGVQELIQKYPVRQRQSIRRILTESMYQ